MKLKITGGHCLIDDSDIELVSKYNWNVTHGRCRYAASHFKIGYYKYSKIKMHRLIMGINDRRVSVDHINGDTLDNRRSNLRIATASQNAMNRKSYSGSSSKFKGVVKLKSSSKWTSGIRYNGIRYSLGTFDNEADAALAYDLMAKKLFGEFARTNL